MLSLFVFFASRVGPGIDIGRMFPNQLRVRSFRLKLRVSYSSRHSNWVLRWRRVKKSSILRPFDLSNFPCSGTAQIISLDWTSSTKKWRKLANLSGGRQLWNSRTIALLCKFGLFGPIRFPMQATKIKNNVEINCSQVKNRPLRFWLKERWRRMFPVPRVIISISAFWIFWPARFAMAEKKHKMFFWNSCS